MAPLTAPAACRLPSYDAIGARFTHVTDWVFGFDNTLYPSDSGIWPRIDERIALFLVELFASHGQPARALHKHYYLRHGTTLCGLAQNHVDQVEFVDDINRSSLESDPLLAREIQRLPGRELIFTNGPEAMLS
jgi:putative hydrolase of the HAD superfamily